MAQTYSCDLCGQTVADYMITRIVDGQSIAVGVECILDFCLPIAEAYAEAHQLAAETESDDDDDWPEGYDTHDGAYPPGFPDGTEDPDDGAEFWEDGYPQGRNGGPSGPAETEPDEVPADATARAAADVPE